MPKPRLHFFVLAQLLVYAYPGTVTPVPYPPGYLGTRVPGKQRYPGTSTREFRRAMKYPGTRVCSHAQNHDVLTGNCRCARRQPEVVFRACGSANTTQQVSPITEYENTVYPGAVVRDVLKGFSSVQIQHECVSPLPRVPG
eukprot:1958829-Rhodomonas_salina.1